MLVITLAVFLLSLLGMPPLAGFAAKFQIFRVLYRAADHYSGLGAALPAGGSLAVILYALLVIGGLNTVLSLFYYVKVLKVMILERSVDEVEGRPAQVIPVHILHRSFVVLIALVVLYVGIFWDPLYRASYNEGVSNFRPGPTAQVVADNGGR